LQSKGGDANFSDLLNNIKTDRVGRKDMTKDAITFAVSQNKSHLNKALQTFDRE
jgi:hypothetical protein